MAIQELPPHVGNSVVIINVTRTHAHTNNADSFGCPLCFCLYLPCSSFMHDWSARFFWESGACPCTFSQTVFELVYGGQCPRKRGGFYFFFFNYYRSDVSVSFASGVLCALSPLARFPSFVLCPAWYAGCFGARGVGRAHTWRAAPSSLHVRTFVTECRPSSLRHVFTQGHKCRRSARHTLNAGVQLYSDYA